MSPQGKNSIWEIHNSRDIFLRKGRAQIYSKAFVGVSHYYKGVLDNEKFNIKTPRVALLASSVSTSARVISVKSQKKE